MLTTIDTEVFSHIDILMDLNTYFLFPTFLSRSINSCNFPTTASLYTLVLLSFQLF